MNSLWCILLLIVLLFAGTPPGGGFANAEGDEPDRHNAITIGRGGRFSNEESKILQQPSTRRRRMGRTMNNQMMNMMNNQMMMMNMNMKNMMMMQTQAELSTNCGPRLCTAGQTCIINVDDSSGDATFTCAVFNTGGRSPISSNIGRPSDFTGTIFDARGNCFGCAPSVNCGNFFCRSGICVDDEGGGFPSCVPACRGTSKPCPTGYVCNTEEQFPTDGMDICNFPCFGKCEESRGSNIGGNVGGDLGGNLGGNLVGNLVGNEAGGGQDDFENARDEFLGIGSFGDAAKDILKAEP